ncbi:MAG: hypothetical protein ACQGVC_01470 [Myxococcota bacterium]
MTKQRLTSAAGWLTVLVMLALSGSGVSVQAEAPNAADRTPVASAARAR